MPQTVWFLTLPGVMALDVAGPAEAFTLADGNFTLRYIGPQENVLCSTGMTIGNIEPLPDTLPPESLLVVPGVYDSRICYDTPQAKQARDWLQRQQAAIQAQTLMLVCVCSGALLAAQAGLLNGIQCTTHHDVLERMKATAPQAVIRENRVFVEDGSIWTSAGITAGIDLALHLITRLCGAQTALAVAREMVVWFRRSGDDPQLSPWLRYRNHLHPAIHRAQDAMMAHPEHSWSLGELAMRVHVSRPPSGAAVSSAFGYQRAGISRAAASRHCASAPAAGRSGRKSRAGGGIFLGAPVASCAPALGRSAHQMMFIDTF